MIATRSRNSSGRKLRTSTSYRTAPLPGSYSPAITFASVVSPTVLTNQRYDLAAVDLDVGGLQSELAAAGIGESLTESAGGDVGAYLALACSWCR